jgi:outer membrane lipoprotein SlyB
MKRYISIFLMLAMMAISIPMFASDASAQTRRSYRTSGYTQQYDVKRPNIYDRHRKAINIGGGAVAGAIIGGLLGGKKGALLGAAAGVAGGAIVTSKQRPRNYYRYRY